MSELTQSERDTLAFIKAEFSDCSHEERVKIYRVIAWAWDWNEPIWIDGKEYAPWSYK